jgi:hypothetical protein
VILGRWMLGQTAVFPCSDLFAGHAQPLFLSIYVGLAVAVFALAGLFTRTRGAALVLTLILVSVVLALGANTPLFRILFDTGLLRFVRFPEKFVVLGTFAAIVFAACTLERFLAGDRRIRRALLAVTASVVLVALAGAAFAAWWPGYESLLRRLYRIAADVKVYSMVALARTEWLYAAGRGALLFLLILGFARLPRPLWAALFFVFICIDLAPQVPEIAPRLPQAYLEVPPPPVQRFPPNHEDFRIFPVADWVRGARQGPHFGLRDDTRIWNFRNELAAQAPNTFGLRTVIDGDIDSSDLRPERDFSRAVLDLMTQPGRPAEWKDIVAAMSNAWYISAFRRPSEIPESERGINLEPIRFFEGTHYPRYYFATQMVAIRDRQEFLQALRTRRFRRQVAFVHQPAFTPAPGTVSAVRESANHARLEVEASGRAFLVMSVTPHKYWRITVDGQETPAIVTNIGFQGVVVPAGRHVVEMRYRNPLVAVGAAVSLITLLGLSLMPKCYPPAARHAPSREESHRSPSRL